MLLCKIISSTVSLFKIGTNRERDYTTALYTHTWKAFDTIQEEYINEISIPCV